MVNENQGYKYHTNNTLSVLLGMLIGGLACTVTMLLLAPQSGKATRMRIREKGIELSDRTTGMIDDVMKQLCLNREKIAMGERRMAKALFQHGQAPVVKQLEHVSETAQAGKKAIQSSQGY